MSKEEPDLNLYETIVRIAKENISKAKDFVKPKRIFYSQNEEGYEDYDPDEDTTPCTCPPVGDKPPSSPTDGEMDAYNAISKNLSTLSSQISSAQSALTGIQNNAQQAYDGAFQSLVSAITNYNSLVRHYNRGAKLTCRLAEAVRDENIIRQQLANILQTMQGIQDQATPIMNGLNIPIVPPIGNVGSPTMQNASRCNGRQSPGSPSFDVSCAWFNNGQPLTPAQAAQFGKLQGLYNAWSGLWRQSKQLNQQVFLAEKKRRALTGSLNEGKPYPTANQINNSINRIYDAEEALDNIIPTFTGQYEAQKNAVNALIDAYNAAAQGLPPASSPPPKQQVHELINYNYTCADSSTKTCEKWEAKDGASIPTRPSPQSLNTSSLSVSASNPPSALDTEVPCPIPSLWQPPQNAGGNDNGVPPAENPPAQAQARG